MASHVLKLGGEEFACIDEMPAGFLLDLAEDTEAGGLRVIAGYRRFLYAVVQPEESERLIALLRRTSDPVSIDDLNEAIGEVMVTYTNRPTRRLSESPPGPEVNGGTSRVVSLAPVMDSGEDQSLPVGQEAVS